ncbi:MAG: dTDP-glucose 4,6-dehydratase [Alphaproteobacteria bacterium]|nr:dTDP-glucose 4,6-dehydratase [Alphaproteobacteria bacterium]
MQTLFVTGAAGFIGSAVCRYLRRNGLAHVVGIDAMTYAASRESVGNLANDPSFTLIEANITDAAMLAQLFMQYLPDGILHLAAETHVDRSIDTPSEFLTSNVVGTFSLLETVRSCFPLLSPEQQKNFRFLHVSTDEIYGSLGDEGTFDEGAPCNPSSPYAATKACADHLVSAWHKTYGLPTLITNCSNNYGPLQFPEKLIPLAITKALNGESIPLYGDGQQVRDWLYVEDHAQALYQVFTRGHIGEHYNIGGNCEKTNIDLIYQVCTILDELMPNAVYRPHKRLITHVEDRPGHDKRYALNYGKLASELDWRPETSLESGLYETVRWYLNNQMWCNAIQGRKYAGQRMGIIK